jgi:hypothetical protein
MYLQDPLELSPLRMHFNGIFVLNGFSNGISKFFSCLAGESARKWWITPCKTIYKGETENCAKHNGELMNVF